MNIKVLKKKPKIEIGDESYIDLSYNSYANGSIFSTLLGFEIVNNDMEMRPDLICLKWYNSTEHLDLLLKANNIFNPYSIQEGDLLIIPAIGSEEKTYKNPGEMKKHVLREAFIDTSRMNANDIARLKALIEKTKDKKARLKQPLPPNMLSEGRKNKKFTSDGQIILTNHHLNDN